MIALTFDDGPYIYEASLLEQFNAVGGKITLFVNGNNWDCIYNHVDTLQEAFTGGHQIGHHTWSHPDITTLTDAEFILELTQLETAFSNILGAIPTYFRPPYGSYNQDSLNVLTSRNYRYCAIWDIDSGDSLGLTVAESLVQLQEGFASGADYHVVLDHETYGPTVSEIVPWLINYVQSQNLQMVTLAECLGDPYSPYRPTTGQLGTPNASWTC